MPAIFEDFNERGEEEARAMRGSRDAGKTCNRARERRNEFYTRVFRQLRLRAC